MKLFVENLKGNMDVFDNVYKVSIKKINNKNHLVVYYNSCKAGDTIPLNEVKLSFLVDTDTMHEYFRYQK